MNSNPNLRIHPNCPNKKLLYPQLSYKITGLLFKTHKELGRFCREKQYGDLFEKLLNENKLIYEREFIITKRKPESPKGNRIDFLLENVIIIEFKNKNFITKDDYIQMQRYLECSGIELGIIVNFRNIYLKPKRILNYKLFKNSDHSDVHSNHSDC